MKKIVIKIVFILFIVGCVTKPATTFGQVNVQDSLALVDLYNSTNGANWTNTWNLSNPVSTWYGVTLQNNRVFLLVLDENNVSGNLPSSLGELTGIASISFQVDKLTGSIPLSFKNLKSLSSLHLVENQLSGEIDSTFLQLPNLGVLSLGGNNFSGKIPNVFTSESKISILDFGYNHFTGTIPSSIANLSHLQWLYVNNNQLDGTIPSLSTLSNVTQLGLNDNHLTFNGMEEVASTFSFAKYSPQANIALNYISGMLSVSAAGTLANDTFHWYKNGILYKKNAGDSTLKITEEGNYSVAVTNSIATDLTLYSDTLNVTPLPVTLLSFTAQQQGKQVALQWQTANELNMKNYNVERSNNGKNFSTIAVVATKGKSVLGNTYQVTDALLLNGTNYYRLKMINTDGSFAYSNVIQVNADLITALELFPNPAHDILNILFATSNSGNIVLRISDASGKTISQKVIKSNGYTLSTSFNMHNLSCGVYYIMVEQNDKKQEKMFIVK